MAYWNKDQRIWYIYTLCDPDVRIPRYCGWTYDLKKRLDEHIKDARYKDEDQTYRTRWVRTVLRAGRVPLIEYIEIGTGNPREREQFWIAWHLEHKYPLTNLTAGGEGLYGYRHTPATIEKMRQTALKRCASAKGKRQLHAIQNMRKSHHGKVMPDWWRAKISKGNKGKACSENAKRLIGEKARARCKTARGKAQITRAVVNSLKARGVYNGQR